MIVPAHQALFRLPASGEVGATLGYSGIPFISSGIPSYNPAGAPVSPAAVVSFPGVTPAPARAPAPAPAPPAPSAQVVRFLGPPVRPVATSATAAPTGSTTATSPLSFTGGGSAGGFDPSGSYYTATGVPIPPPKPATDKSWLLLLAAAAAGLTLGG